MVFYKVNNNDELHEACLEFGRGEIFEDPFKDTFFPVYFGMTNSGFEFELSIKSDPRGFYGKFTLLPSQQFKNVYYTVKTFEQMQDAVNILTKEKNYLSIIRDYQLDKEFFNEVSLDGDIHVVGNSAGNIYLAFTFFNEPVILPGFHELQFSKGFQTGNDIRCVEINGQFYNESDIISLIHYSGLNSIPKWK